MLSKWNRPFASVCACRSLPRTQTSAPRSVEQTVIDGSFHGPLGRGDLWHQQQQERQTHELYAAIRFRQWMVTADPSATSAEIGLSSCGAKSRPQSVSG